MDDHFLLNLSSIKNVHSASISLLNKFIFSSYVHVFFYFFAFMIKYHLATINNNCTLKFHINLLSGWGNKLLL